MYITGSLTTTPMPSEIQPYFDAHLHLVLKSVLAGYLDRRTENSRQKRSPWRDLTVRLPCFESEFASQSNLRQVKDSGGRIVVHALLSPDPPILEAGLLQNLGPLVSIYGSSLKKARENTPWVNVSRELLALRQARDERPDTLHLPSSAGEVDPARLNILFSLEGAHNLFDLDPVTGVPKMRMDLLDAFKQGQPVRLLYMNLTHLSQWSVCTHCYGMKFLDFFLTSQRIRSQLRPQGIGLKMGIARPLIEKAYDTRSGHPIWIDVKHMSLVSRLQFYELRKHQIRQEGLGNTDRPILASHVGVTGCSLRDLKEVLLKSRGIPILADQTNVKVYWNKRAKTGKQGIPFYPNTINLYDEEITEIINSGGLIGLSFDRRILGGKADRRIRGAFVNTEYFSRKEFYALFPPQNVAPVYDLAPETMLSYNLLSQIYSFDLPYDPVVLERLSNMGVRYTSDTIDEDEDFPDQGGAVSSEHPDIDLKDPVMARVHRRIQEGFREDTIFDLLLLANNIIHILHIGGPRAWNHICLGSDFDGIIDPLTCCPDITHYGALRIPLLQMLFRLATPKELHVTDVSDMQQKLDGIFYQNGRGFLEKYFR